MEKQQKTIVIDCNIEKCYQAICDIETYPQWQDPIKNVSILDRDSENRPCIVEFDLQILMKKINYTLHYYYDKENYSLTWDYVGGDLKNIEGSYVFEEIENEKTSATCAFSVELGVWIPKTVMKKLKDVSMLDSMKALKKRAESL